MALIQENELPLAPDAGDSLSIRVTSAPIFDNSYAIVVPMIPAPMMMILSLLLILPKLLLEKIANSVNNFEKLRLFIVADPS